MDIITKYFNTLSELQLHQLAQLSELYSEWNNKINVISRKDIQNLYIHHVLHSLAIAKWINFPVSSTVLDLGAGGGFPSIPLAIFFPNTKFTALDSTNKKLVVIQEIAKTIGLQNIQTVHARVEEHKSQYHFVVSRAVATMRDLIYWSKPLILKSQIAGRPNGLIALKGGDLKNEFREANIKNYVEIEPLSKFYDEEYFEDKKLCYVQL